MLFRSDIPENDKAEAIGATIDELSAIYTQRLFESGKLEDTLTKKLPLFYRKLVDKISNDVLSKFRQNIYERGTPIPVGKDIRYAFTDDSGKMIRIPELDNLIQKAMASRDISMSDVKSPAVEKAPLADVIREIDLSHRFTKNAAGEYSEKPSSEVEEIGRAHV